MGNLTRKLEHLARRWLPPTGARLAKRATVYPRYRNQLRLCRRGFQVHGDKYAEPVLFIAGLPKSGTTWLERMVSIYPGYHELLIPDVAAYELRTGGSHDYDLPRGMFDRFQNALVLTKMHVHGSTRNVKELQDAGVPYVILFRDLRDVAVSNYHYIRRTPWHPEYPVYRAVDLHEGLILFAERTLDAYVAWILSWIENHDPERSIIVRYEDLLMDTTGEMTRVSRLFKLDHAPDTIKSVVDANSFIRLSEGRTVGEESTNSFFRKGVVGDWENHFTDELRTRYERHMEALPNSV